MRCDQRLFVAMSPRLKWMASRSAFSSHGLPGCSASPALGCWHTSRVCSSSQETHGQGGLQQLLAGNQWQAVAGRLR
jgi:hypothetical protein